MRNIMKLVSVQLAGMLGISRFVHTRDRREKARRGLVGAALLLAAGVIAATIVLLGEMALPALRLLGMEKLVPPLMFAAASIACLITSVQTGAGALFDTRDVQILLPMPLRARTIVCARLLGLYAVELLVELVVYVPVMVLYARYTAAAAGAYAAACVLGALALPVLPLMLGTAVGTLVQSVSARFRHSNIAAMVLLTAISLGALAFSFLISFSSVHSLDIGKLLRLSQTMTDMVVRVYPPTRLFVWASEGSLAAALGLAGVSAGCFVLMVLVLGHFYLPLHGLIGSMGAARRGVKENVWRVRSPFRALLLREGRRMLASPIYAINTTFGQLLMVIFASALWLMGDQIFALLAVGEFAGMDLRGYVSAAAAFILYLLTTMMPTTCVSISLEGASFMALRTLPVRGRTIFAAKAAFNMLLMLPAVMVSAVLLNAALGLTGASAAACYLLPLSGVLLAPAWGLIANLLLPRFDWKSEAEVVKQGASVLAGMFGALALSIGPLALCFAVGANMAAAALWLSLAYTALAALCWGVLLTWGEKRLAQIG